MDHRLTTDECSQDLRSHDKETTNLNTHNKDKLLSNNENNVEEEEKEEKENIF